MPAFSPERWRVVSPYLERALEMTAEERSGWLVTLRAEDPTLADDLALLLQEREAVSREGFLEGSPPLAAGSASLAGHSFGAYTLVSQIGQGGMGSVWLARRSDGRFEGLSAVKLLNASLIGHVGGERFSREGQILARLRHPHIAQLIDAGVSGAGQPYLVLEHVDGQRIDSYCDAAGLDVGARLRLFLGVLDAVSHAHANLIVHRDIKPSNVLVTQDGRVKLLDFGIAKLIEADAPGATATALTREGGVALTPEYAAPEQVTGGAITTATDVYALGVLLYLLLSGKHPAGDTRKPPAELYKAILESEPVRLSEAVAPTRKPEPEKLEIAAKRATSPERLRRQLRGDLDTIVAKALKKAPQERYASAEAFADDLRRLLSHEPIRARPDTLRYRAAKFVRRHRLPVALTCLGLAALVGGLAGTVWQAHEAARQRDLALAQLVRAEGINEFNGYLMGRVAPAGQAVTMRELLERAEAMVDKRFASDEALAVELLVNIGDVYAAIDETDNATRTLKRAYEISLRLGDPAVRTTAACGWARAVAQRGDYREARRLFDSALALLTDEARFDNIAAGCHQDRGYIASLDGDTEATVRDAQAALDRLARAPQAYAWTRANALHLLALAYDMQGRTAAAEEAFAEALQQSERIGRADTSSGANLLNNWAFTRAAVDTLGALDLQQRAIAAVEVDGQGESVPVSILANYGVLLNRLARYSEAHAVFERARRAASQHDNPRYIGTASLGLARSCRGLGDLSCTEASLRDADDRLRGVLPPGHRFLADLMHEQGMLAAARGDIALARRLVGEALAIHEKVSERHVSHVETLLDLSNLERMAGDLDAAERYAREALGLSESWRGTLPHSAWSGLSQLALGEVTAARDGDATALFAEALANLTPTLGEAHAATHQAKARARR